MIVGEKGIIILDIVMKPLAKLMKTKKKAPYKNLIPHFTD